MRFEVYDENYEVMASFNEHLDALDYFNNNPCKFVYDTILGKVVEGSDKWFEQQMYKSIKYRAIPKGLARILLYTIPN